MITSMICGGCKPLSPFDTIASNNLAPRYNPNIASTIDVVFIWGDSNAGSTAAVSEINEQYISEFATTGFRYNTTNGGASPHTWEAISPGVNTGELPDDVSTGTFGVETVLAGLYFMAFNRPLYVVKTAFSGYCVCGTPPFSGSFLETYGGGAGYANLVSPTNEALGTIIGTLGFSTWRTHAVIFIGANDAASADATTNFQTNLSTTLTSLEVDVETFTSVHTVKLSPNQNLDSGRITTINAALDTIAAGNARFFTVSGDTQLKGDQIHYAAAGQIAIGKSLFQSIFFQ